MRKILAATAVLTVVAAVPAVALANTITSSSLSCNQLDFTYEGFAGQVITLSWSEGGTVFATQTLNPPSGAGVVSVSPPNLSAYQGDAVKVSGTWSGGSFSDTVTAYCTSDQGSAGPPGPAGPAGPQGPPGATGAQGPPGINGTNGPDGQTGPAGPAGSKGSDGLNGATGPAGNTGNTGATGQVGPTGPKGSSGKNGKAGKNGRPGKNGKRGPHGANGKNGKNGTTTTVTKIIRVTLVHKIGKAVARVLTPSQSVAEQHHWNQTQMRAFWGVLFRESSSTPGHVNLHAINPPSYGAGQFEGGPAMYYRYGGNPNTVLGQLTAVGNYIAQRYGLPTRAYQHELADHDY